MQKFGESGESPYLLGGVEILVCVCVCKREKESDDDDDDDC